MHRDLGNHRKSYNKSALTEQAISDNPMELFQKWYYEVEAADGLDETNAMSVSTMGLDGFHLRVLFFILITKVKKEKRSRRIQEFACHFFGPIWNARLLLKERLRK